MPPLTRTKKIELLNRQIEAAKDGRPDDFAEWRTTTETVLRHAVGEDSSALQSFRDNTYNLSIYTTSTPRHQHEEARIRGVRRGMGYLRSAIAEVGLQDDDAPEPSSPAVKRQQTEGSAIFIVHGRNNERKETVARFLRNLTDIEPVILHEQPSGGATLIEKLERYGLTAGFAVVLATGDDIGRVTTDKPDADRPRARQNVILELGYFFGVLGREKVALLYDPEVEIPSDIDGLVYIEVDTRGAWKIELTREFEAAGYTVDRAALK
jgi:predicted nucleotide-binding protein